MYFRHYNLFLEIEKLDDLKAVILSPGPCTPDRAGICIEAVRYFAGKLPILGVCLGHQAIGEAFGGKIVRADRPMHGKVSDITHCGKGVFANITNPFKATRYHSLIIEPATLPARRDD